MAKSHARGGGAVSFNMTPMIDIVFNLIIFFMLVSQFYRLEVEPVKLPPAAMADPKREEVQKYQQIVINVIPPDPGKPNDKWTHVKVGGKTIVSSEEFGDAPNWQPLIDLLQERREAADAGAGKPVNVILRAGESVPYETIGSIMLCASTAGIPYWWVQAARPGENETEVREWLGVEAEIAD